MQEFVNEVDLTVHCKILVFEVEEVNFLALIKKRQLYYRRPNHDLDKFENGCISFCSYD